MSYSIQGAKSYPGTMSRPTHPNFLEAYGNAYMSQYQYKTDDLAKCVSYFCREPMLNQFDPADERHQRWIQIIQSPIPNIVGTQEIKTLLNTWMIIFDHAYFSDTIKTVTGMAEMTDLRAHQALACYIPSSQKIFIDPNQIFMEPGDHTKITERAVAALLHEMLHAFFDIYGCRCKECWEKPPQQNGLGKSQHGPPWIHTMCNLQNSLSDTVNWWVECGIGRSAEHAMEHDNWEPDPQRLAVWRLYE